MWLKCKSRVLQTNKYFYSKPLFIVKLTQYGNIDNENVKDYQGTDADALPNFTPF